ncbi:MAG TPA: molecular chaperone, partial [Scandinavium sp.]
MFKNMMALTLTLGISLGIPQVHAALSLGATRIIIDGQSSNSVEVINSSTARYGVQSWVEDGAGKDPGRALVVTPSFQAIDGKQKAVLRLLSFEPVQQKELLYYLNVQEIPPKLQDKSVNHLSLAVRTRIKVLIRPAALNGQRKQAEDKIEIARTPT